MEEYSHNFDAIVVGAGPAGSMAAWKLATEGFHVALLERGRQPGEKNLFGGMIYSLELQKHFPGFFNDAPIERAVTRHATHLIDGKRSLNFDFSSDYLAEPPYNGFTAYRSRFDNWLARQAVNAGAVLIPSTVVDALIIEGDWVRGVVTRRKEGDLRASVTICADGVLSLLGRQAGLVPEPDKAHYSLGVREIIALPAGVIEDRFQIPRNGGCAALFAGNWNNGLKGGGFIYTYQDTLSVGFVAQMPSLVQQEQHISEILDAFKKESAVQRLISGGERLEYGAHVVPEGGWNMRHGKVKNGLMLAGDAAGLVLTAGVIYEGVHYAMHSGVLAAETAVEALRAGDTSRGRLKAYETALNRSYVIKNLKAFKGMPHMLTNPRLYKEYPEAMTRIMEGLFIAESQGHLKGLALIKKHLLSRVGLLTLIRDGWQMIRNLL